MVAVGVLVVVVGGAGIAAAAVGRSSEQPDARAQLSATNLGDGTALAERAGIQTTTTQTVSPATTAPVATAVPTTRLAPTTTAGGAGPEVAPTPTTTPTTTTTAPTDWMALMPPRPSPENPTSWSVEENGVSVRLRMTPIAPHVGDTVEFTIESSITIAGGACCLTSLRIGQEIIYQQTPEPGGCTVPPPPARLEHREGRVIYEITGPPVMAVPGPLILNVGLSVTRLDPCQVPFGLSGASLDVPVTALYPHR
jgi:hypothetical protein